MADEVPTFTVDITPILAARLRAWGRQMSAAGRLPEFVAAVEEMNERLKTSPHVWGDPLKDYNTLRASEMRGLIPGWFMVWYGVATEARYVRVRDIQPAPGSPLSPA